ncbi:MAG: YihA family ribosome biogenesis GTP-binding protein [Rhodospirillaceae bacterium]|jgi:GTP-binding protein|nr:YihA family ribosome biogenesis GTP-binding protein [Rhodospirillaceae bacterium]MBT3887300.1 YihA family ribosome biogenesis GTP-binding protein [Rhodospirillaceae bacterium]MBT4118725.1 YihA family ribosome biogenesis GTP-binding protein [Rhodospirillaceae bacterium]MBT4672481.1 YihA family ribosome biogenesis GTP-binding protein [Rhodospirillaceae bacterium]MBT4718012.1 YihA family ribosome biogenesis GTP-binding protein [Rhodospirillaceae bacterium]
MMAEAIDIHSDEMIEAGRVLFAGACDFVMGAAREEQLPPTDLAEIAFAGRSNVGKSSLINALTGRKALARTSNTPGRTREVNFFDLGDKLMIADLPGYGYARASKTSINNWTDLIERYLKGRRPLRRVCLLIDARHGLKDSDRVAMKLMDASAVVYQIVLTKSDKIKDTPRARLIAGIQTELAKHTAAHPDICATSAVKGTGIPELRAELAALALEEKFG